MKMKQNYSVSDVFRMAVVTL